MDDPNKSNSPDGQLISREQDHDVRYGTAAFSVSKEALQRVVGNSVDNVREALHREEARKSA